MKIYVNANAGRDGNGTAAMPFRHINDAAKVAMPGDEVLVAPGIYREYVDPVHAGTEDARISYRSTEPLGAVITGAEQVRRHGNSTTEMYGYAVSATASSAVTIHIRPSSTVTGILQKQTSIPAVSI